MLTMEKCRSCGAPVIWLKNEKTGKPAPVNVKPDENGNILMLPKGEYRVVASKDRAGSGEVFYTSHFVSCPQQKKWRS